VVLVSAGAQQHRSVAGISHRPAADHVAITRARKHHVLLPSLEGVDGVDLELFDVGQAASRINAAWAR